jgi:hypothetical protein
VITKSDEHEIDRAGKRLFRSALEKLGWVLNDVQEDYGIDSNIQVFDGTHPTGAWFHAQLKSSSKSHYSTDHTFVSQELSVHHARHYALEMRQPIVLIHADVTDGKVYWHFPQLAGGPSYREAKGGAFDFSFITKILCTPSQTPHPPDVTMILTGKAATASTL